MFSFLRRKRSVWVRKVPRSIKSGYLSTFRIFKIFRYLVVLAVILATFYLVFHSGIIFVKEVSFFIEGRGFEADLIKDFIRSETLGKNIFLLNKNDLTEKTKKKFLTVRDVRIDRTFPSRLSVLVLQRDPIASILPVLDLQASVSAVVSLSSRESSSSAERYLVDKSGLIFVKAVMADFPLLVVGSEDVNLGDHLDKNPEKFMVDLITKALDSEVPLKSVVEVRGDILAILKDQSIVWLSKDKQLSSQLEVLKMILEKYKIEAKKVAKVDLRFRNPVVEFR